MQQTTSLSASDHSTHHPKAAYAAERAKLLFGGYRRGDANDPDTYVAAIAAVLACYDTEVIKRATDPRTGISQSDFMDGRFRSFMPNSGELKAYCDQQESKIGRERRWETLPSPQFRRLPPPLRIPAPGDRANVLVLKDAPQYARMVALTSEKNPREWRMDESDRGIWVSLEWLAMLPERKPTWKPLTPDELRAHYARPMQEAAE